MCVCVWVPDDYKGLGLVDHMSSGDRGVCMCASVFTGMRVLACRYMLIRQKRQRGLVCAALKKIGKLNEVTDVLEKKKIAIQIK